MSPIHPSIPVRPRAFNSRAAVAPGSGGTASLRAGWRHRAAVSLSLLALLPGLALGAGIMRTGGSGIPLLDGGLRAYPWLNLALGYDSNIYRSNKDIERLGGLGVKSSWQSVVEPGIRLNALRNADSYDLTYFARIGNFFSSSDDNFIDQQATATANWELALRHRLSLDYQYWNWHDPRGTGSPADSSRPNFSNEPDRWISNRATLGYSYGAPGARGRIDLLAGYRTRDYINNNQESRDNDRTVLGATFFARVLPKVSLLTELGWEGIDYTREPPGSTTLDSDQTTLYGGLTWDVAAKTTGTVKLGWLTKDFVSSERENVSDLGWSAQMQWRPRTYSTVNVVTERVPAESATGLADAVVVSSLRLDWVHFWKKLLYTRFGALGTTDDYVGSPRVDHRYGASAGVFYQATSKVEVGVDYSYDARSSDEPLAEYTDNAVVFSLKFAP